MAYNKSDLVSKIAQKSNLTKAQAEAALHRRLYPHRR